MEDIRGKRYTVGEMRSPLKVTVCWQDTGVSFVLWDMEGKVPAVLWAGELDPETCSAGGYRRVMKKFLDGAQRRNTRVIWVVFRECFPSAGTGGPGCRDFIPPEWMERCWKLLPQVELPDGVVAGAEAVATVLQGWQAFRKPGRGLYCEFSGRGYFFAYGEETCYRRVSRADSMLTGGSGDLDPDWLQQTRMLYRSRTGYDLREVFRLVGPGGFTCTNSIAGSPIDSIPSLPEWMPREESRLATGLLMFHASGCQGGARDLKLTLLDRRRARHRLDSVFRWGAISLLGGWLLLLQGACRQYEAIEQVDPQNRHSWEASKAEWMATDRKWRHGMESARYREAPYRLVGSIARTVPNGVELDRIRIRRAPSGPMELQVQGSYTGELASPVFKAWMDGLKSGGPLAGIENLRFERDGNILLFRLDAKTGKDSS